MPKKPPAHFLAPVAFFIGLLIVILAIANLGDNESLVPASDESKVPAEPMKMEETNQTELSQEAASNYLSKDSIIGMQIHQIAKLTEQQSVALKSTAIEEALIQREITKAKIAAEYSSVGDGTLTEADFRRYAEERYLMRRDLNGNGKLDGFELRAIGQAQDDNAEGTSRTTNKLREL